MMIKKIISWLQRKLLLLLESVQKYEEEKRVEKGLINL